MAEQPTTPPVAQLPLSWIGTDEVPIQYVNQTLIQIDGQGEFLIAFGQSTPPALTGPSQEDFARQIARIAYVPVRPISRIAMTRPRVEQVIQLLQRGLQMHDEQTEARRVLDEQR